MRENNSLKWTIGCKFDQLKKNHSYHSGNRQNPYTTLFSIDTKFGLQSTDIPREKWAQLETAKDLFEICGIPLDNEYATFADDNIEDGEHFDVMEKVVLTPVSNLTPSEQTEAHNIVVEANANHLMGIKEPNVIR